MSNPPPPPGAISPQWQPPPQQQRYGPVPPALAPNGQQLASFSDRFLAYLIDYAINAAVSLILVIPFMVWWMSSMIQQMQELRPTDQQDFNDLWTSFLGPYLLFIAVSVVFSVLYTYVYWVEIPLRRNGQTFGKSAMKIRVIPLAPGAAPLTRGGYAKRWAVQYMVGMIVPLFSLLDGLWQLWDKPLQQCLHDKAADTVVVKVG